MFDSGWDFSDLVLILLTYFGWVLVIAIDCGDLGWEFRGSVGILLILIGRVVIKVGVFDFCYACF